MSSFRAAIGSCGPEVLSLTDVGLPEPDGLSTDPLLDATRRAALVAALTETATVAHARAFCIDPLLRWGGGGPQWSWPLRKRYTGEDLPAALKRAHAALDAMGYCGPDDRGAYFRFVLCLVQPGGEAQVFEGRLEGQFGVWGRCNRARLVEDYFVPDGERVPLACLTDEARQHYSDQERAFAVFCRGFYG